MRVRSASAGRRHVVKAIAVTAALAAGVIGVGVLPASAAPVRAPRAGTGTFDCGGGVTGTFLTNTSNSDATSWSPAFLTFTSGGTGRFVPSTFDFIITFNGESFPFQASKG